MLFVDVGALSRVFIVCTDRMRQKKTHIVVEPKHYWPCSKSKIWTKIQENTSKIEI